MVSMIAMARGRAALAAGARSRVFDWKKAAALIMERKATTAGAGLKSDWEYTGGTIWSDGKPVPQEETYTYLSSNWATPELEIDGEIIDCWIYEDDSPGWDSGTYWPQEALDIIGS